MRGGGAGQGVRRLGHLCTAALLTTYVRLLKATVLAQPGRRNAQTFRMWAHIGASRVPTVGLRPRREAAGRGRGQPCGREDTALPRGPRCLRLAPLTRPLVLSPSRSRPSLEEAVQWQESLDKLLQNDRECARLCTGRRGRVRGQDTPGLPVSPYPGFDISSVFQSDLNKGR